MMQRCLLPLCCRAASGWGNVAVVSAAWLDASIALGYPAPEDQFPVTEGE